MSEIICYTTQLPQGEKLNLSFFDLLLDENLANGSIICPKEVYAYVGALNTRLWAKQNYEFLLRAIEKYPVYAIGMPESCDNTFEFSDEEQVDIIKPSVSSSLWDEFCTDCYIVGKYSKELMEHNLFNPVVETLLGCLPALPDAMSGKVFLEKMLSRAPEFYEIDDDTRPILIYRGDDTCYNQLNVFADELTNGLKACKQRIEVYDVSKEDITGLTRYTGMRFKAIIGIQTYLFSIKMKDKTTNLHDLIIGPKFNMIFDHPVLLKKHIAAGPSDYYLLVHDRNYLNFAKQYYKNIKDCFFLSPGGIQLSKSDGVFTKKYDVSFIGTYYNYRQIIANIRTFDKKIRYIANRFLMELRYNVNLPTEKALSNVLQYYEMELSDEEFLDLLFELRYVFFGVMYYYREKVVRTLLNNGVELHVYGDSWNTSPLASHPCLKMHPAVTGDDVSRIMAESKISLNIMAWHKDGFTERIANSMLNGSVAVSDTSTQLQELFVNGEDLVLFDLDHLDLLPEKIKNLLSAPECLKQISENGMAKIKENHLWSHRAKQLLNLLHNIKE